MLTEGFIQNQKQFSNDKEKFEKSSSWTDSKSAERFF